MYHILYLSSSFCQRVMLIDKHYLHDYSVSVVTGITIRCLYCTFLLTILILIMCIYHALINALAAYMIHTNLNIIFYTHVEYSPTIVLMQFTQTQSSL